jgi:RNA polymerase sigma-70 factor (ECF subfamily)
MFYLARPSLIDEAMDSMQFGLREWQLTYRAAMRVLKQPHLAEDAAQDALLNAYRSRHTFRQGGRYHSWLYRVAVNTAIRHLRRRRHPVGGASHLSNHDLQKIPSPGHNAEEVISASELSECVSTCLRQLSAIERLAFTERFLMGTSESDLGKLMGVSTNTAKQRAFRVRRKVRSFVREAGWQPACQT